MTETGINYSPTTEARPEYWQGHNPEDDCWWIQATSVDLESHERNFKKADAQADIVIAASYPFLTDFLEKKTSVALAEFRMGTTFDARSYGVGTIIREHSETLEWDYDGKPLYYQIDSIHGVVCEPKLDGNNVRAIAHYIVSGKSPTYLSIDPSIIEVGEVEHYRMRGHYLHDAYPNREHQSLQRILRVEILHAGLGQSQQERNVQPASLRVSPQTSS